jgi:uncharacterized protein YfaS (alpha-2-macroglobulin family)
VTYWLAGPFRGHPAGRPRAARQQPQDRQRPAQHPELADANEEARPSWWYFSQTEIHDNRVALFATDLPKGTYSYTYLARATTAGTFQTLPATAYRMYSPEVFGRSAGAKFVVAGQ